MTRSPNTPRPELGGRTPEHQAENEEITAICFGGIVACLLLAGALAVARAIWERI